MPGTPNKVKYGLKNVHYAKATFDEDGNVTYATPARYPGAVTITLNTEGEPEPFYADDIEYYTINNNIGYKGDFEAALMPESFAKDIMGEEEDENGVMVENTNAQIEHYALLFEFSGDQRNTRHVLYNCTSSRASIEGERSEATKKPKTEKLSISASPLSNGIIKAKTCSNTSSEVYNNWFSEVYMPTYTPGT